ncbi:SdrD B-like domain-containing protein [Paenibacillus sp. FA6]|uniref:SdrD B-like domain-containing protein n=1 Tax=Paenibacillus sp. FA6 TaxID=3413029 RepID=UPI003F65C812
MAPMLMITPSYAADRDYPIEQSVTVKLMNGGKEVASTTTYEDGKFLFLNVADGTYTVKFSTVVGYNIVTPVTSEESITIDSGENFYSIGALYSQIPNVAVVQTGEIITRTLKFAYPDQGTFSFELVKAPTNGTLLDYYNFPMFQYEAKEGFTGKDEFIIFRKKTSTSMNVKGKAQ